MLTLQIPADAVTLELSNSVVWLQDGILYSRPKPGPYLVTSREQMDQEMALLRSFIGPGKVNMLAETHPQAESPRKEDRDYIADRLHELVKAMAIITPNAVSRMVTNLFFLFKPPSFPTKMFVNVSDARKWLQTNVTKGPDVFAL